MPIDPFYIDFSQFMAFDIQWSENILGMHVHNDDRKGNPIII